MLDLFKAEIFRFRVWIAGYFLLHCGLIAFYGRMIDLLQLPTMIVKGITAVYLLSGLLFGLHQMSHYRRPNRWLNLLHRPVAPRQIAGALIGAAMVAIGVAIVLPMIIMLTAQDLFSARVVDQRHWMLPAATFLSVFAAYLAAAYVILGVRRYAWLIPILLVFLGYSEAIGIGVIAIQALIVLWLCFLVMSAFQPAVMQVPARPVPLLATALSVQMALYLLLVTAGGLIFQVGWIMIGTHPLNGAPPEGGHVEASGARSSDLLMAGLARRHDQQTRIWREQVRLSDPLKIQPGFAALPARGEMTNMMPIMFDDEERAVRWTFSHDSMRFEGRSLRNGTRHGSLGLSASNRSFAQPPATFDDGTTVNARTFARFEPKLERMSPRINVPAGETIATRPQPVGDSVALLTDKALYLYDREVLDFGDEAFPARQRIRLSGRIGDLSRIDFIELLDGYLLSQTFGRWSSEGGSDGVQHLEKVDGSGKVIPVAQRALSNDFPAPSRFHHIWLSPVLQQVYHMVTNLFAPKAPLQARLPPRIPNIVWLTAIALNLLSAIATFWWTTRSRLDRTRRLGWTGASAAIGLPAFLSLCLLYPLRRNRV
ncbi:hypothetical protein [Sphingosinicella rhizophila]|uniref:Uncharacterized protein n=1 Tax=Sphingosinicella rhizophila TaxID=3050082 RepID=A0ABU3QBI6_9SPHN|nr:hypothetical protein [Sphingosinicella sp. GR2756]MDT9600768.1 hypothetical protein [Sphingosinicella sp. GR2756]